MILCLIWILCVPYSVHLQDDESGTVTISVGGCSGKLSNRHSMTDSIDVETLADATSSPGANPEMTDVAEGGAPPQHPSPQMPHRRAAAPGTPPTSSRETPTRRRLAGRRPPAGRLRT